MSLGEFQATIESMKTISFDPLQMDAIQKGQAVLPEDFDTENTYDLFCLFIPERIWQLIATHTNLYAELKNAAFN